jgi:hypothetical protein
MYVHETTPACSHFPRVQRLTREHARSYISARAPANDSSRHAGGGTTRSLQPRKAPQPHAESDGVQHSHDLPPAILGPAVCPGGCWISVRPGRLPKGLGVEPHPSHHGTMISARRAQPPLPSFCFPPRGVCRGGLGPAQGPGAHPGTRLKGAWVAIGGSWQRTAARVCSQRATVSPARYRWVPGRHDLGLRGAAQRAADWPHVVATTG